MHKLIRRMLAVLTVLVCAATYAQAQSPMPSLDDALLVVDLKDAKWTPSTLAGIPPGVLGWTVAGDAKTGPAINYAKYPPGYVFPMHWHSYAEYTVVVSGMVHYLADGKSYDVVPGSFVIFPAKIRHQVTCGNAGPCVVLIRRAGPVDYHFEK
jgi:quercetin dioxygenase-like cupin family protein